MESYSKGCGTTRDSEQTGRKKKKNDKAEPS